MAKTKRFFISDIHLSLSREGDWYKRDKHAPFLCAALDKVAEDPAAKDLVLLGDVFDLWMSPLKEAPPSARKIIDEGGHEPVWQSLKKCAARVENIFYVNGNHDMQTTQQDLDHLRAKADLSKPIQKIERYNAGRLYAEHGNRFAMFNAPDRLHDPADALPLGYFITRILYGNEAYLSPSSIGSYVDDLLEAAFTTETIASSVIEALMEANGKRPSDVVVMADRRRDVTLAEVRDKYAKLFDRWVEKFGYYYAINAIRGELNSLGWFADRLCKKNGYKVVVFGHTHDAMEDVDGWFKADRIYLNSGYFCTDHPTFVEVDKLSSKLATRIWRGVSGADFELMESHSIEG